MARVVVNAAIFALGEVAGDCQAPAAATLRATSVLLELFPATLRAAEADEGPVTPGDRASGGGERAGQSMGRLVHATLLQSLGVLGMQLAAR